MKFQMRGLDGEPDFKRRYIRLQKMLNTLPPVMVRDAMADAGGVAIRQVLPTLKTPNFGFTDRKGRLRGSLRTRKRRNFGRRTGKSAISVAYAIAGNKRAHYGLFVHEGHGGPRPAPPHPFLDTALSLNRQKVFTTFAEHMAGRVPTVVKGHARRNGLRARAL